MKILNIKQLQQISDGYMYKNRNNSNKDKENNEMIKIDTFKDILQIEEEKIEEELER